MLRYWKTYSVEGDTRTHIDGISDSSALCGCDLAGDDLVHRKQPECVQGKARVTCPDCLAIIATVKEHLRRA